METLMETESNEPFPLRFPIGAKVRIKETGEVGTVQGYFVTASKGKQRAVVDRPHGISTMRQSFDLSEIEGDE